MQPNAEVSQIVGVTAVGNESLGAFLEKSRQFLFQKLRRQRLLHLFYSTAQTNEGRKVNVDPNIETQIQESGEVRLLPKPWEQRIHPIVGFDVGNQGGEDVFVWRFCIARHWIGIGELRFGGKGLCVVVECRLKFLNSLWAVWTITSVYGLVWGFQNYYFFLNKISIMYLFYVNTFYINFLLLEEKSGGGAIKQRE